ncbi:MAG: hypothetical protein R3194_00345 [Limnobacter sp.]|nr:hypothetical protein [Limnobacter sp.]
MIRRRSQQQGLTFILNVFFVTMSIGALAILGVGQVLYERGEMQKIADTTALEAARQISDGPPFDSAFELAERNGLNEDLEMSVSCLIGGLPTADRCEEATRVRVEVTQTFLPFFFLNEAEISVEAEADLAPLINGQVETGLLSLNTQQSEILNGLFSGLGLGEVSLTALGWNSLVGSTIQVPLVDLGLELNAVSLEDLATIEVTGLSFINAAFAVARADDSGDLPAVPADLSQVLDSISVRVQDIVVTDLSDSSRGAAELELGQLIQATLLGAVSAETSSNDAEENNSAVDVPLTVGALNINLSVQLLEPPKVFVGRKVEGKSPIVEVQTAQARIVAELAGSPIDLPDVPGLGISLSGPNLNLAVSSAGGSMRVNDIGCRMPRETNTVDLTVSPSLTRICLAGADGQCDSNANVFDIQSRGGATIGGIGSQLDLELASSPENIRLTGLMPQSVSVPTGLNQGLSSALTNIDFELEVNGNNALLRNFQPIILAVANDALSLPLVEVGQVLDDAFAVLGVGLNNVEVDVNFVDCKSSILTL